MIWRIGELVKIPINPPYHEVCAVSFSNLMPKHSGHVACTCMHCPHFILREVDRDFYKLSNTLNPGVLPFVWEIWRIWHHIWKLPPNTSKLPVAFFQKLEYVTENCFGLLIFVHTNKNPSKCSIPMPNGYHQWLRTEVLPLESVLRVWKGHSRSISGLILSLFLWFIFPINPPYHEVCLVR